MFFFNILSTCTSSHRVISYSTVGVLSLRILATVFIVALNKWLTDGKHFLCSLLVSLSAGADLYNGSSISTHFQLSKAEETGPHDECTFNEISSGQTQMSLACFYEQRIHKRSFEFDQACVCHCACVWFFLQGHLKHGHKKMYKGTGLNKKL